METKTYDSKLKYIAKYDKQNCIRFGIKLNKKTDADIIKLLENVPNKQGFIKTLIRRYIESL